MQQKYPGARCKFLGSISEILVQSMWNEAQEPAISLTSHHPCGSDQEWATLGQTVVRKPVVNSVILDVIIKWPFA